MASKLGHALALAGDGFKCFPIAPGKKAPPMIADWPSLATDDAAQINAWWSQWPDANVGIHCDGLAVVDIDRKKGASLEALKMLRDVPMTRIHQTPSGGHHILLKASDPVTNGIDILGSGYDVRGLRGYIVGPGSTTDAGEYAVLDYSPIADAPQWLLDKCKPAPVDKPKHEPVPDGDANTLTRAREWLVRQEPAVEGQGGDARTYAVACSLRDLGVSRQQALGLMQEWNFNCAPPWSADDLYAKVANAYTYSQNDAGIKSPAKVAEMFEAGPAPVEAVPQAVPSRLRHARSLAALKPGPQLWEGVLPEKAIFAIGALPGRSKSYLATGLCYALATDAGQYLGRAIPTGTAALYVDVERIAMTELRVAVWCFEDGKDPQEIPLLLTDSLSLLDIGSVKTLIAAIQTLELARPVSLVIIDSLGAALPGADLNMSSPATMTGKALRYLKAALDCAIGVVAHSPKSGSETVAGSMHFDAIFDTTIFMRSDTGAHGSVYVKKDNSLALDEHERVTYWRAQTIHADIDERKIKVHRLVLGEAIVDTKKEKLKGNSLAGWQVLCDLTGETNTPVDRNAWRDACYTEFLMDNKQKAQRFLDLRRRLLKGGYITDDDGSITRKCE